MLWGRAGRLACPLLLLGLVANAQDLRTVTSPNGKIEFRIFSAPQREISLFRLAYQVLLSGEPAVETSFMGLNILDQEPILGENVGLISATGRTTPKFNELLAKYVQNGSTGRSIDVEIRVYDTGVAFRYIVPKSALLEDIDINAELTEFRLPRLIADARVPVPFFFRQLRIDEVKLAQWPALYLKPLNETTLITDTHFAGITPVTCPWRVIGIGGADEILNDLNR